MIDLRRFTLNSALTLTRQALGLLVSLGTAVILARSLGPHGQGSYALALLLPSLITTFTNVGLAQGTVYQLARRSHALLEAVRGSLALAILVGLAGYAIALLILAARPLLPADPFAGVATTVLVLGALTAATAMLQSVLVAVLQGIEDFLAFNAAILFSQLMTLGCMVVAVPILDLGVVGAVSASVVAQLISVVAVLIFVVMRVRHREHAAGADIGLSYNRAVLRYGARAYLSNVVGYLNYRADTLVIAVFLDPAAVGLYVIAYQLVERLWLLSQGVGAVLLPRVSALYREKDAQRSLTPIVARHVLWLSIVAAVVVFVVAPFFVPLVFGSRYEPAVLPLQVLLPGVLLFNVSRTLANDIAGRGRPELNAFQDIVTLIINIALNVLLVPPLGILGAAIASTISYSINAAIRTGVYARLASVRPLEILLLSRADLERLALLARAALGRRRAGEHLWG